MTQSVKVLDTIDYQFLDAFHLATHTITLAAVNLAYWLAYISILVSVCFMLLQNGDLNKMLSKLIKMGFLFGLFFGLITLCGQWIPYWLNSFMQIGAKAGNLTGLDPSSIFDQGFCIAATIFHLSRTLGITHIPTALLSVIASLFIVIIYAFIAANLVVVLIKAYALITVGPLIFAFGMNDITRPTVNNYIQKLVGMGLNLLVLYIIIGAGVQIGNGWVTSIHESAASGAFNFGDILVIIGGLVIFFLVVTNVPAFIAEISGAGGFRDYGQAAVASAMAASAMTANAIKNTALAPTTAMAGAAALGGSVMNAGRMLGGSVSPLTGAYGGVKKSTEGMRENFGKSADAFKNPGMVNKVKGMYHATKGAISPASEGVKGSFAKPASLAKEAFKRQGRRK